MADDVAVYTMIAHDSWIFLCFSRRINTYDFASASNSHLRLPSLRRCPVYALDSSSSYPCREIVMASQMGEASGAAMVCGEAGAPVWPCPCFIVKACRWTRGPGNLCCYIFGIYWGHVLLVPSLSFSMLPLKNIEMIMLDGTTVLQGIRLRLGTWDSHTIMNFSLYSLSEAFYAVRGALRENSVVPLLLLS